MLTHGRVGTYTVACPQRLHDLVVPSDRRTGFRITEERSCPAVEEEVHPVTDLFFQVRVTSSISDRCVERVIHPNEFVPRDSRGISAVVAMDLVDLGELLIRGALCCEARGEPLKRGADLIYLPDLVGRMLPDDPTALPRKQSIHGEALQSLTDGSATDGESLNKLGLDKTLVWPELALDDGSPQALVGLSGQRKHVPLTTLHTVQDTEYYEKDSPGGCQRLRHHTAHTARNAKRPQSTGTD